MTVTRKARLGAQAAGRNGGPKKQKRARMVAFLVTAVVAVIAVVVGLVIAFTTSRPPADASPTLADAGSAAPDSALAAAANAVGFHRTSGEHVGIVENLSADTPLLAPAASLLPVGRTAPDFMLRTPQGKQVRLSDYAGKIVFLEFFATWCPHCQAEAQHLIALAKALPPDRYAFLSVNADSEDAASIYAFERFFALPWPALRDQGTPTGNFNQAGGAGPVTKAYGVALYPTFYVIDAKGRIAWRGDREQPDTLLLRVLTDAAGA
ncbi:MAG: TlpA disulfide reductase family protein [Spirochaetia bacterium]|jgi:thiol-disulfide isomerase/thioredoxin